VVGGDAVGIPADGFTCGGQVAHGLGEDERRRALGDGADGQRVIGQPVEDLLTGSHALGIIDHGVHGVVVVVKGLDRGRRLFAVLAVAPEPAAPLGSWAALADVGGDEPAHFDRKQGIGAAVCVPAAAVNQALAPALVVERDLDLLGGGFDTNFAPEGNDDLGELVGGDANARPGVLDVELEHIAVRAQAEAVAVALRQPHVVQQLVGQVGVVLGPVFGIFRFVILGVGHRRQLAHLSKAEEEILVDLLAVDGDVQRFDEIGVLHDFTQHEVFGQRVAGIERVTVGHAAGVVHDLIVLVGLVFLVEGITGNRDIVGADVVELALDGLLGSDVVVGHEVDAQIFDIGQLLAGGIDLPVVGVPLHEHEALLRLLVNDPGGEHGILG